MRYLSATLLFFIFSSLSWGQLRNLTEEELKVKLDSVLMEANRLYMYERATWIATDLALRDPIVKTGYESYLTYETGYSIKTIILGDNMQKCIAEYTFFGDFEEPDDINTKKRDLSLREMRLLEVRERIMEQLENPEYDLGVYDGFSLNFILIPFEENYKFYVITGTSQSNIIPFGNDYLFIAEPDGQIESWKKFHTSFLPTYTNYEGKRIRELTHSHINENPLISATDICTFMLYAPFYGVESFSVYSDGIYMEYSLKNNDIIIKTE